MKFFCGMKLVFAMLIASVLLVRVEGRPGSCPLITIKAPSLGGRPSRTGAAPTSMRCVPRRASTYRGLLRYFSGSEALAVAVASNHPSGASKHPGPYYATTQPVSVRITHPEPRRYAEERREKVLLGLPSSTR